MRHDPRVIWLFLARFDRWRTGVENVVFKNDEKE